VIDSAHAGTGFAFASWVKPGAMDMAVSALFPTLKYRIMVQLIKLGIKHLLPCPLHLVSPNLQMQRVIDSAHAGTGFAFASWVKPGAMDMAVSALFPILFIAPGFTQLANAKPVPACAESITQEIPFANDCTAECTLIYYQKSLVV
jgi:nucleoside permease NupC